MGYLVTIETQVMNEALPLNNENLNEYRHWKHSLMYYIKGPM